MADVGPKIVPVFQEYMNPILAVLRTHGALPIERLDRLVAQEMRLAPEVAAIPHNPEKPDRSEASYRMAWARTYLKQVGLLENPARGEWAVTARGRDAGVVDPYRLATEVVAARKANGAEASEPELPVEAAALGAHEDEELGAARVCEELARQLREVHASLVKEGAVLDEPDVARFRRRFREKFGPEVLGGLDGEALLTRMHGRETKDSLVYWLEFKDDEEFPSSRFGSIGGGSALKFGIYQANETRYWMTGAPMAQVRLSIADAVAKGRAQRDQLLAGVAVLEAFAKTAGSKDYAALQRDMTDAAPDLAESSWGYKYFSLLFPDELVPFHGVGYQVHQLRKLLKVPADGRYENARIFVGVGEQLGLSLFALAVALNRRNGSPHGYWRVGTTIDGTSEWPRMRDGGFMAVGWPAVGDLSEIKYDQTSKEQVRALLETHYPDVASAAGRAANQLFQFVVGAQERDLVVATDGERILGVGQIQGPYRYEPDSGPVPHRRDVKWLRTGEWKLPEAEGLRATFVPIRKPLNIVEAEARLLGVSSHLPRPVGSVGTGEPPEVAAPTPLTGVVAHVNAILQRKRQVILFGPPGTGKTYWAERAADELAVRSWFGMDAARLDAAKRDEMRVGGAVEMCSFHPAFGYEDFLEGYRPEQHGGALSFRIRDGVFKRLCDRAARSPRRSYYLRLSTTYQRESPDGARWLTGVVA